MMPYSASTPRSPRLETVMVGSEISELRMRPARVRCTRSRMPAISSSSGSSIGVVHRRRRQPAAANGDRDADMDRRRRLEFAVAIEPVEGGKPARGQSDRLDGQRAEQQPAVRRRSAFCSASHCSQAVTSTWCSR